MNTLLKVKDFVEQCKERKIVDIVDKQGIRVGNNYNYYPNSKDKDRMFIWFNGTSLIYNKIKNYTVTKIRDVEE